MYYISSCCDPLYLTILQLYMFHSKLKTVSWPVPLFSGSLDLLRIFALSTIIPYFIILILIIHYLILGMFRRNIELISLVVSVFERVRFRNRISKIRHWYIYCRVGQLSSIDSQYVILIINDDFISLYQIGLLSNSLHFFTCYYTLFHL